MHFRRIGSVGDLDLEFNLAILEALDLVEVGSPLDSDFGDDETCLVEGRVEEGGGVVLAGEEVEDFLDILVGLVVLDVDSVENIVGGIENPIIGVG